MSGDGDPGLRRDDGQRSGKAGDGGSVWRQPAVMAAIMGGLIAGIFGVIQFLLPRLMDDEAPAARAPDLPASPAASMAAPAAPALPEITTDPKRLLVQASRMLADRGTPVARRIEVIRALALGAGEGAPTGYHPRAIDIVVEYLRRAVDERRHVKDEHGLPYLREEPPHSGRFVEPDLRMTRPLSIVAALETLATLRDAAPQPVSVNIGGIDFSHMILTGLDLSGFLAGQAKFRSAFLSGCDCRGTNFNNADLSGAVIWGERQSRFSGASFINVPIDGSKWANVDLTGAVFDRVTGTPAFWCDIEPASLQARFAAACPKR